MRIWNLQPGDPLTLTLAADSRLIELDYTNDHIWELILGSGEPESILLQTTYGLRARNMRLFPQFVEEHRTAAAPADFETPPTITRFYPNYLEMRFSPFPHIQAILEYWVPNGQTIAGRIRIANNSAQVRNLRLELAAVLNPSGEGQAMQPVKKEATTVLIGRTEDLYPVLFITGGAEGVSSPYTSLNHELNLQPGMFRRFTWVLAALPEADQSFRQARLTAARNWDAGVAEVEMTNASQLEIFTGNTDWDAAIAMGQKTARSLIHSPTKHLPYPSLVSTRNPDQGYSRLGDGSDYNHLWNGQTAIQAWYLAGLLLPDSPELARGLLFNFLSVQEDGTRRIDWKPGLAGQRSRMLATPILVSLAWRIYEHLEDKAFLKQVFRPLMEFVHSWFNERQDRDRDGIPEWDNSSQSGFDDNPSFSRWHKWSQGADISLTESPDLCAYLYREVSLLRKMGQILGKEESLPSLEALADNLRAAVVASWDPRRATYQYWDRESHQTRKGEVLKRRKGSGELLLDMVFELPVRILLRLEYKEDLTGQVEATVHGRLPNGKHRVERIKAEQFLWVEGISTYTLPVLFADLEHIQIEGLPAKGKASVHIIDHRMQDHTLLLPLWAGIPDEDAVSKIIQRKLEKDNQYGKPYGIPACPKAPHKTKAVICESVWLPWNVMVAEGLLAYGAREEAAGLFSRLMEGITENLKREHAFRKHYHASKLQSLGERNDLEGLPPVSLLLDILGVRIISPWEVHLDGFNPFPQPIKLKYRGLKIECHSDRTAVTFPDGQNIIVADPAPCVVTNQ